MTRILTNRLQLPADVHERGRIWRDHLAPVFDIEFGRDTDLASPLDLTTYLCADSIIGSVSAPAQRLERTEKKIVRQGLDHLLFQFYESGSSVMRAEGRESVVTATRFLVVDLARPVVLEAAAVDAISLIVPRRAVADVLGSAEHLHGRAFDLGEDVASQMLRRYLRDLVGNLGALPADRAMMMSRAAVALCCTCLPMIGPELRSTTPLIKLAIRQFVEEALPQPSLTIATVVSRFGLSRAKLQRLFEPEGGFACYVSERRLKRAFAALTAGGDVRPNITAVAYAHGYADLSSFSRAFRRRFGVSPRHTDDDLPLDGGGEGGGAVLLSWMNQIVGG